MSVNYTDPTYLEQVYAALFVLLQNATFPNGLSFNTTTRVINPPDEVPVVDQPALILMQGPSIAQQGGEKGTFGSLMTKWTFTAMAGIYLRADSNVNPSPLPITVANYFTWGIMNCFSTRPPNFKQTLGGLVINAWIEGPVHTEVLNEQVEISIPIYMLAGPSGVQ